MSSWVADNGRQIVPYDNTKSVEIRMPQLGNPFDKPARHLAAAAMIAVCSIQPGWVHADESDASPPPTLTVGRCVDFRINGKGDAPAWRSANWVSMNRRAGGQHDYVARFKMLYSDTGAYVLFDGTDKTLTATMKEDFLDLWNEDVFECFFWTDEKNPIYFEYEISPLGYELPILVPNMEGQFLGWRPWHYEGDRKIQKQVSVTGGVNESMSSVTGWRAEVFIPYELLRPLQNVPPEPATRWRANFYRVDYDDQGKTAWDWARVGPSFHEFEKFGTIIFE